MQNFTQQHVEYFDQPLQPAHGFGQSGQHAVGSGHQLDRAAQGHGRAVFAFQLAGPHQHQVARARLSKDASSRLHPRGARRAGKQLAELVRVQDRQGGDEDGTRRPKAAEAAAQTNGRVASPMAMESPRMAGGEPPMRPRKRYWTTW